MKIINNIQDLQHVLPQNKTIGFVPTMGALHKGHLSLIEQSVQNNDITVVSIFVNPTQFLINEDLSKYPRPELSDKKICELAKVDYLFMPDINAMYCKDEIVLKAPKIKGFILEGERRAGHFDGMLQIVLKLINLVNPTNSYFGKKDAQQLYLIEQMKQNFYLKTNIIPCEIIREDSGLAMSSRNIYLSEDEKQASILISSSLNEASKLIKTYELDTNKIINTISKYPHQSNLINIEYIYIVNKNFDTIKSIEIRNSIILIAVKIGNTRLIDNIWI